MSQWFVFKFVLKLWGTSKCCQKPFCFLKGNRLHFIYFLANTSDTAEQAVTLWLHHVIYSIALKKEESKIKSSSLTFVDTILKTINSRLLIFFSFCQCWQKWKFVEERRKSDHADSLIHWLTDWLTDWLTHFMLYYVLESSLLRDGFSRTIIATITILSR